MKTLLSLAAAFGVWFGPAAYFECMWLMFLTWIPATFAFIIMETETSEPKTKPSILMDVDGNIVLIPDGEYKITIKDGNLSEIKNKDL